MTEPVDLPPRDDADARAWFYLDHRADIETWAALRTDGAELLERNLYSLEPDVDRVAAVLGASIETGDIEAGENPRFGLYRSTWTRADTVEVSLVIEWESRALLGPRPANRWPWVGVRVHDGKAAGQLWTALVADLAPIRRSLRAEYWDPWPLWRYVTPPASASGVDVQALAQGLLDGLHGLWLQTAPVIDAALDRLR